MNNLFLKINRKILFLIFFLILFGNIKTVIANNQEIGFFKNDKLQEILQKPFYLYHSDKETAIPFFLKDYIDWQYYFIEDFDYVSEIENPFLCHIENQNFLFCELTKTFDKRIHNKKVTQVFIEKEKTIAYLESLSARVDSEPENGKIGIDEKGELRFVEDGKMGHQLNVEESYEKIVEILKSKKDDYYIPLVTAKTEPELSRNNFDQLGIKEKIGTGESNFKGSTENRKYNIEVATTKFHGSLIEPGEEFSFVERLGDVDGENGYKKELVIKKNTTIPEFGGGICQVSTTMFRVALNTGLKITERHNHAYPVSYYNPPGSDATIYIPAPDLKFINDTKNHILIQSRIEGTKLFFDFYGSADGRQVTLIGPTITEKTPEGKIRTVLYQEIKDADGNEVRKDVFKSFYDNHDNYPNPNDIFREKPKDWSGKQWDEYYEKYGRIIEQLNTQGF